jgi:hypothetical protein
MLLFLINELFELSERRLNHLLCIDIQTFFEISFGIDEYLMKRIQIFCRLDCFIFVYDEKVRL